MKQLIAGLALLPSLAYAGTDFLTDLAARLKSQPQFRASSANYGTAGILVFGLPDTRTYQPPAKHKIVAVSVSGLGDTIGYVLKKNGTVYCSFYGVYDGSCLTLAGCISGTLCN